MKEVSCWAVANLLLTATEAGMSRANLEALVAGLDAPLEHLQTPSRRVSWDDFTTLLDRLAHMVGGPEELERFARVSSSRAMGTIGAVLGKAISVRPFYFIGVKFGRVVFRSTRGFHADLPDGRIRQTIEILPGYRNSIPFFHCMRATIVATPSRLGLPDPTVDMELADRRARYTITPPIAVAFDATRDERLIESVARQLRDNPDPKWWLRTPPHHEYEATGRSDGSAEIFLQRVRDGLTAELKRGDPTAERVATHLHVSARTLARRLAERGTTFQAFRDEFRKELALHYLEENRSIGEVAYELGFSDPTSFHRAFRRWTGCTPTEFAASADREFNRVE